MSVKKGEVGSMAAHLNMMKQKGVLKKPTPKMKACK